MMYLVHAMEQKFHGENGVDDWAFVDMENIEQAIEYGYTMCISLMMRYSTIDKALQKKIATLVRKKKIDKESAAHKVYRENAYFTIYQIEEKFASWYEMSKEFHKDKEKFLNNFCSLIIDSKQNL